MSVNQTDVVAEYLREVELRLSGLPLLQRHELLADLRAHIDTAREQGAYSEGEIIEVLERLGTPEAIAAAAYWEAGPQPPRSAPATPAKSGGVPGWVIGAIGGVVLLFLMLAAGAFLFLARGGSDLSPQPMVVPAEQQGGVQYFPDAPDAPDLPEAPAPRPTN